MIDQLTLLKSLPRAHKGFRPIHYLGNKTRVLGAVERVLDTIAPPNGRICDLFTGSGVVAWRLARNRPVVAVDIQEYSRVVTSALLCPAPLPPGLASKLHLRATKLGEELLDGPLTALIAHEQYAVRAALGGAPQLLADIVEYGAMVASASRADLPTPLDGLLTAAATSLATRPSTVLTRYYGGLYFSFEQAAALDALSTAIRELPIEYRDTALAALLSAASELVSTVGNQFAQPVRPRGKDGSLKNSMCAAIAKCRLASVRASYSEWLARYERLPAPEYQHSIIRSDFRNALAVDLQGVTAIYADPPYTRDHYSRFYHVLETIALGDEPKLSTVKERGALRLSRALYRADRHQSPFCIKSQVFSAFRGMFEGAIKLQLPLVLSYSPYTVGTVARPRPRLVTIDELTDLANAYFSSVVVQSAGRVAHSKLNVELVNGSVSHNAEIFLIALP